MSERFDLLVIGSGCAGLSVALAARGLRVAVATRGVLSLDGSSCWAQGGIAAAVGPGDSPGQHAVDTLSAGLRHNHRAAVRWLTESGPETVDWLVSLGVRFDRNPQGRLLLGREAAHSFARIAHAGGDATGAELMRALREALALQAHVTVFEFCRAERLLSHAGACVGARLRTHHGEKIDVFAQHVVLATGGIGHLYRYTTNPVECDGSGLALASELGAELADLEFVQFHPTALAPPSDQDAGQLPLITEALRGAGAVLVDDVGERFMQGVHPLAELAPRDVVARSVWLQLQSGRQVFLDARRLGAALSTRFPTVFQTCIQRGIDPRLDPIPVVPAAHYHMGGIKVDLHSMTRIPGLYAVGEAACTGVHGANRLASNSLLEAVSFGRALGERLARLGTARVSERCDPIPDLAPAAFTPVNDAMVTQKLRQLTWSHLGVVRTRRGLQTLLEELAVLERRCLGGSPTFQRVRAARLIAEAAWLRKQSLGAHHVVEPSALPLGAQVRDARR